MKSVSAEKTLRLTVDNIGFLLDKLGEDCHPLQFLRELTQNAIEAILQTPEQEGAIVWDVDWLSYDLADTPVFKLCVTDTGCGMTGEQLVKYINQLSASGRVQASDANFGVGAKIAAATRNHAGLIYLSWQSGRGAMIHLWRDPETGQYGLRQIQRPDGTFGHWGEIDDNVKPDLIQRNGTRIILWGNIEDADTMQAPKGVASPSTWIAKYLNTRYFKFPNGIAVKARQGWEQPRDNTDVNLLRTINGQAAYLESHKQHSGVVLLSGANAHWWILKDESALSSNSGWIESAGHTAALYQDELYEMAAGRTAQSRLRDFGVIFGYRQVVIYVEPQGLGARQPVANVARTSLQIAGQRLPWEDWATEFRNNMPEEIVAHMEAIASRSQEMDHSKSIKERLKELAHLYKVSRYKVQRGGLVNVDAPMPNAGGDSTRGDGGNERGDGVSRKPKGGGAVGGVYSVFLKDDGAPGREVSADFFPRVKWVCLADGTRSPGDMEDRAAQYLESQNLLLINADFRVFTDMIDTWTRDYDSRQASSAGMRETVKSSVHSWFQQALEEAVIGLQALRGSKQWSVEDLQGAWSEIGLTAVVMQRYHVYNCVKRELGSKLGPLK